MSQSTLLIQHIYQIVYNVGWRGKCLLISENKLKRLLKESQSKKLQRLIRFFENNLDDVSIYYSLAQEKYNIFKVLQYFESTKILKLNIQWLPIADDFKYLRFMRDLTRLTIYLNGRYNEEVLFRVEPLQILGELTQLIQLKLSFSYEFLQQNQGKAYSRCLKPHIHFEAGQSYRIRTSHLVFLSDIIRACGDQDISFIQSVHLLKQLRRFYFWAKYNLFQESFVNPPKPMCKILGIILSIQRLEKIIIKTDQVDVLYGQPSLWIIDDGD